MCINIELPNNHVLTLIEIPGNGNVEVRVKHRFNTIDEGTLQFAIPYDRRGAIAEFLLDDPKTRL